MSDREAFEKWYAEAMDEPNVRRYADSKGVYTHLAMQSAWLGWQAAQAQAVNQQLLDDIANMLKAAIGAIKLGQLHDAVNYLNAAIAAAQEQGKL